MGRNVLGFPFLLTCIHLQVLPIDWTLAIVGAWRMQPTMVSLRNGSEGGKAQDQHLSQQLILFFISALMLWISQGLLLSFFMISWMFWVFFFFNSILFLCNPWMNYFLTILENSPYMYGLCFIQVFFQFMLFSISRLEAFFRYLVILGSLHMFQSEDYKVEWELWAHRMGWLRMNFPVEWLTWTVWEPPVCRIFVPCPGLWQWKRWVLTSGHPGNSHLDHLIQHPGPQLHFYLSSVSPSPRIKPPDSAAAGKDLRSNLGGQTASPTPLPVPKVPSTAGCKAFWGGDRVVYMGSY